MKNNPTFGGDRGSCHLSMKVIPHVQVNNDAYQDFEAKSSQQWKMKGSKQIEDRILVSLTENLYRVSQRNKCKIRKCSLWITK